MVMLKIVQIISWYISRPTVLVWGGGGGGGGLHNSAEIDFSPFSDTDAIVQLKKKTVNLRQGKHLILMKIQIFAFSA